MPSNSLLQPLTTAKIKKINKKNNIFRLSTYKRHKKYLIKSAKLFYKKWHLNHLVPIPFISIYMIFGALLFWLTENKAEFERQIEK